MSSCFSWRWLLVGMLCIVGGYWIGVRILLTVGVESPALPLLAHALSAACGGAIMTAHAPLRPWREPLAAGVLAIGVLGVLVALPYSQFWVVAHVAHPVLGFAVAAGSGLCSGSAAWVVRRFATTTPTTASIFGVSLLLTTGSAVTFSQLVLGLRLSGGWMIGSAVAGVFFGGYLTQRVIPVRRPWICGAGPAFYCLWAVSHNPTSLHVGASLVGSGVLVLIAALGAWVGWRRNHSETDAAIPPARVAS